MAKYFSEIIKSNPYPRQKGGRFGFAVGAKAGDFDPYEVFMGEAERYQNMTSGQRAAVDAGRKAKAAAEERREADKNGREKQKLDAGTDFEPVPDGYRVPGIKTDSSLRKCRDFGELKKHMQSGYGIELYGGIRKYDFESVSKAVDGITRVLNDMPGIQDARNTQLFGIGSEPEFRKSGYACYESGNVQLNSDGFGSPGALSDRLKTDAEKGWSVPNSSAVSVGAHEAAHHVEKALTDMNPDIPTYMRNAAFQSHREAQSVVRTAMRNVGKTEYGRGKTESSLQEAISGYAMLNYSETMAEAFADCVANGAKANPLSQEIRRVTIHRMRRFQGKEN